MSENGVIKLHDLRPAPGEKKAKTRVGRGEGSKGKTAGRGTKGTGARKNVPVTFEGGQMPIQMRLPKLKGFRNRFRTEYDVVNVGDLARLFPAGGDIGVEELVAKGAVRKNALIKVLGDGKLTVSVNVTAHKFSGSARDKITAAGGSATELSSSVRADPRHLVKRSAGITQPSVLHLWDSTPCASGDGEGYRRQPCGNGRCWAPLSGPRCSPPCLCAHCRTTGSG